MQRLLLTIICAALVACAGGGGGGGSSAGAGSSSGSTSGDSTGPIRLVAIRRDALSPSSTPHIWLFAERPAGAQASSFILQESGDGGLSFFNVLIQAQMLDRGVFFEVPQPAGDRVYRIVAPRLSNAVVYRALPGSILLAQRTPQNGERSVPRTPTLSVDGGSGAASFLYAVADENGTLVYLVESTSAALVVGSATAETTFIDKGALASQAPHLSTIVALDGSAFGVTAARRVDFTTAP